MNVNAGEDVCANGRSMWMRLSALAKELGGAKLLFTSTASAELF